jgi:hypothetical protein
MSDALATTRPSVVPHPSRNSDRVVEDGQADLLADFRVAGANRLNILLVQDDMIGSARQVEHAFLSGGHTMKETEKQPPLLSRLR